MPPLPPFFHPIYHSHDHDGAATDGHNDKGMRGFEAIGGSPIAGDAVVGFDNCEGPPSGELLCQALRQSALSICILGKSTNVAVLNNAAFHTAGDNPSVAGDMGASGN